MRTIKIRRMMILSAALLLGPILSAGCTRIHDKPAAEVLHLVLAGMAGSDGVSFEGASSLLLDGNPAPEASLFYGGTVSDHNKVSLHTFLPDGGTPQTAAGAGENKLKSSSAAAAAYYTRLEKKNGQWTLLQEDSTASPDNPLPALNPLRQLEELENLEIEVSEEAGAARGTRVLRIELSEPEAGRQLAAELEGQMKAIRPDTSGSEQKETGKEEEALQLLWEKKNNELQQKLKEVSVRTVYYLQVDTKRNLPKRLTCTRRVNDPANQGTTGGGAEEIYLTEVNFYGYR
ncbi:hypothetical protein JI735_27300 [Paenibacillus sonchi]|uniref:Uncharacterized protein n=2 Tax=Paenibacillus sonchi TaxID=373687 RepID=A0A974SB73_9BACL|nr:hypothetical protein [Paenibacillus sonchi]QQZ60193.1 hypothetical protein JI735_27300 [Paenibacillus sonchi]